MSFFRVPILRKTALCALLCVSACLSGCGGTRTVYVRDGEPVRLAEPVVARVWVADKDGKEVLSRMEIPEGWYALPDTETPKP